MPEETQNSNPIAAQPSDPAVTPKPSYGSTTIISVCFYLFAFASLFLLPSLGQTSAALVPMFSITLLYIGALLQPNGLAIGLSSLFTSVSGMFAFFAFSFDSGCGGPSIKDFVLLLFPLIGSIMTGALIYLRSHPTKSILKFLLLGLPIVSAFIYGMLAINS